MAYMVSPHICIEQNAQRDATHPETWHHTLPLRRAQPSILARLLTWFRIALLLRRISTGRFPSDTANELASIKWVQLLQFRRDLTRSVRAGRWNVPKIWNALNNVEWELSIRIADRRDHNHKESNIEPLRKRFSQWRRKRMRQRVAS